MSKPPCSCGHPHSFHDTGWDAAGCMHRSCSCNAYREANKVVGDLALAGPMYEDHALREENARLRQRVEELEREAGILTKGITDQHDRAEAAEANLARCVEALDRTLTEAGMQAHKHGCPERLCRPAKWDEHAPCAGCQAEAALAVKGGE